MEFNKEADIRKQILMENNTFYRNFNLFLWELL